MAAGVTTARRPRLPMDSPARIRRLPSPRTPSKRPRPSGEGPASMSPMMSAKLDGFKLEGSKVDGCSKSLKGLSLSTPSTPPHSPATLSFPTRFNPSALEQELSILDGTPLGKLLRSTPDIVVNGVTHSFPSPHGRSQPLISGHSSIPTSIPPSPLPAAALSATVPPMWLSTNEHASASSSSRSISSSLPVTPLSSLRLLSTNPSTASPLILPPFNNDPSNFTSPLASHSSLLPSSSSPSHHCLQLPLSSADVSRASLFRSNLSSSLLSSSSSSSSSAAAASLAVRSLLPHFRSSSSGSGSSSGGREEQSKADAFAAGQGGVSDAAGAAGAVAGGEGRGGRGMGGEGHQAAVAGAATAVPSSASTAAAAGVRQPSVLAPKATRLVASEVAIRQMVKAEASAAEEEQRGEIEDVGEMMAEAELMPVPALLTTASSLQVLWVNAAYHELIGHPKCSWLPSTLEEVIGRRKGQSLMNDLKGKEGRDEVVADVDGSSMHGEKVSYPPAVFGKVIGDVIMRDVTDGTFRLDASLSNMVGEVEVTWQLARGVKQRVAAAFSARRLRSQGVKQETILWRLSPLVDKAL